MLKKYRLKELKELPPHRLFLRFIYAVAAVSCILIISASLFMRKVLSDIPSIDKLDEYTPSLTTYVYDMNNDIAAQFSMEKRKFVPLEKIPLEMQNAVIAMEDNRFFEHWGISPRGIMRALMRDLAHMRIVQGGSTITQQLSKLLFLKPERTIARKIKEMVLALQIERNFSKQEILQMYLNQIYFGGGVYGVSSAANLYFNKEAEDLNLEESAMLAGLVASPETYSPFNDPPKCMHRRSLVLRRMYEENYITREEYETAVPAPLPPKKSSIFSIEAPYFVEEIRRDLEPKYGASQLWKGGLKIYTTLDLGLQKTAKKAMDKYLDYFDEEYRKKMEAAGEISNSSAAVNTLQGAFIVMDVKTGAVRTMIGGRDFEKSQFNRATQAKRQAGSTFKPFVWLSALMNGYTPATMVEDAPLAFYYDGRNWKLLEGATDSYSIDLAVQPYISDPEFKIWIPSNFDHKFLGRITLRRGLELSRNLVSVYLVTKIGSTFVVDTAHRAGIRSGLDAVPSVGLGTSLVTPLEMLNAFSTLANEGIYVEPFYVRKVEDADGRILEEHAPYEEERFSPQNVYVLLNMMKGVVERGTGRYVSRLGRPIAGKTGTSQDSKDLWFIGMTPELAAVGWVGYDDYSSMPLSRWTGGGVVAPWWTDVIREALKDMPETDFRVPEGVIFVTIDPQSGKLALPTCRQKFLETFVKGSEPDEFCDIEH